jgi:hypothetical protein
MLKVSRSIWLPGDFLSYLQELDGSFLSSGAVA